MAFGPSLHTNRKRKSGNSIFFFFFFFFAQKEVADAAGVAETG